MPHLHHIVYRRLWLPEVSLRRFTNERGRKLPRNPESFLDRAAKDTMIPSLAVVAPRCACL